jgi:hypothetical protein
MIISQVELINNNRLATYDIKSIITILDYQVVIIKHNHKSHMNMMK